MDQSTDEVTTQIDYSPDSSDKSIDTTKESCEDAKLFSTASANTSVVEELDEELDSLLDSVVEDFKETTIADGRLLGPNPSTTQAQGRQSDSQTAGAQASAHSSATQATAASSSKVENAGLAPGAPIFDPNSMSSSEMDDQIRLILGEDPQLLEGFQKLSQAAEQQGANSNPQTFADTLTQTLNSLGESAENLKSSEFDEDAFMRAMEGSMNFDPGAAGDGDQAADFLPMMQNMMHSLLSKEVLYPSLKDMADKYPAWLTANKSSTPKPQFDKYARQFDIVAQLMDEYDSQTAGESATVQEQRFERILDLMTKMQDCGPPPKDIVSSLAPGLNFDSEGNPVMPGLPNLDQQCLVM